MPGQVDTSVGDPTASVRRAALELGAASLTVLFQELALIRWLPAQVRVLGYFPNLVLISAFLGLGIGCLVAHRRSLIWLWPLSLLALTGAAHGMGHVVFTQASGSEHLWLLYFDLPRDAPVVQSIRVPIVAAFVLSAVTFVPLGQLVARRLAVFRERSSPLWGYSWDLGGSLVGVVGFAVVSFLQLFPAVWFALVLAVGLVFFRGWRALAYLALAAGVVGVVHHSERAARYSPYYALSHRPEQGGVSVSTNGSLHQIALPMEAGRTGLTAYARRVRECYHFPYSLLERRPGRALVLGAGTGNDVAVLLEEGAEAVDAVEIDPVIVSLGRRLHPSKPYAASRVRIHVTDARSFLNDTDRRYDLIVFGTLDSQTRLSAQSNVRLDNFVYTREAVQKARSRLTRRGGIVMLFMVGKPYIHERILTMLGQAFGEGPVAISRECRMFNMVYLAGPAFAHLRRQAAERLDRRYREMLARTEVPSDDWPYLYLEQRGINLFYLSLMGIFLGLAVVAVLLCSSGMRASLRRWSSVDLEMLLFGAAFLLLETTFVTSMNLVWGATWLTSAVVFGSILAMVLGATVLTQKRPLGWPVALAGLLASLLLTYLLPVDLLVGRAVPLRLLLSTLYVGAPVFFASVCFALRFRVRERIDLAFGWNLLGAVAGGLLEFSSMLVGFKALSLVAVCCYLGVALVKSRRPDPEAR